MPVTVKLSRKFYETFGDEIAAELVEWFNQVDATYRGDLRELNELNFSRFDAKLEQRVAALDARIEQRVAALDAKIEQRVAVLDSKIEQRVAELGAQLRREMADQRADLIKWMFIFWVGTVVPLAGLILALHKV
jgi:ABC-type phosphate transport system auxiliary subunit